MIIDKSKKGTIILSHYRSGGTQLKSIILSVIGDEFSHNYIGEINFDETQNNLIEQPQMAKEGGLMNLGGNEMDLRGGGFVPLGAKEKADDVPARLSKNEFVFTADAVRAAGGGSVDKGAEKMYNTMKRLEGVVA